MMAPPAVQFPADQHATWAPELFPVLAGPGGRAALPQVPAAQASAAILVLFMAPDCANYRWNGAETPLKRRRPPATPALACAPRAACFVWPTAPECSICASQIT